jgi:hypothetical protein
VAAPLAILPILNALARFTNLSKNAEGIPEPNPFVELLKLTLPCDFTITHTHNGGKKLLHGSLT